MTEFVAGRTRLAAYGVIIDEHDRILLCRLTAVTSRPGAWTLPGGGVEFGEHPESAVVREVEEETGLKARVGALLGVDSYHRTVRFPEGPRPHHAVRIVYRVEVDDAALRSESGGTTDLAQWHPLGLLHTIETVDLVDTALELLRAHRTSN